MITVRQFIEDLQKCDPDAPVVFVSLAPPDSDEEVIYIDDFTVDEGWLEGKRTVVVEES